MGQFQEIVLLNVLEHAPCNVGIYHGELLADVKRLVLAVEDTPSCRLAVNISPALAEELKSSVAILRVIPESAPKGEEQRITTWMEEVTKDLPFRLPVEKIVIRSKEAAKSIIEQVRETDLLLMGASRHAGRITSLFGPDTTEEVMKSVCVPSILLKRYQQQKSSRLSGILTGR
jgi:nucleotide-binding universal stress UspA family protein